MQRNSSHKKRIEKHKELVQKAVDSSRDLFHKTLNRVNEIKEYLITQQDPTNGLRF